MKSAAEQSPTYVPDTFIVSPCSHAGDLPPEQLVAMETDASLHCCCESTTEAIPVTTVLAQLGAVPQFWSQLHPDLQYMKVCIAHHGLFRKPPVMLGWPGKLLFISPRIVTPTASAVMYWTAPFDKGFFTRGLGLVIIQFGFPLLKFSL
jgi:hypothetical protein